MGDVLGVLILVRRGAAQVCHVLRAEVEEEDGDRQEEEEVESGEGRIKENASCR